MKQGDFHKKMRKYFRKGNATELTLKTQQQISASLDIVEIIMILFIAAGSIGSVYWVYINGGMP